MATLPSPPPAWTVPFPDPVRIVETNQLGPDRRMRGQRIVEPVMRL